MKTLLAKAALSCRKVTSWVGLPVDPVKTSRQEEAIKKTEHWLVINICGGLVNELVDTVAARSVTDNIVELVMSRS